MKTNNLDEIYQKIKILLKYLLLIFFQIIAIPFICEYFSFQFNKYILNGTETQNNICFSLYVFYIVSSLLGYLFLKKDKTRYIAIQVFILIIYLFSISIIKNTQFLHIA